MVHAPIMATLKRLKGRPAAISMSIVLAGASCVLVASSSSATVSSGNPWPSGLAHPAAASCPRGQTAVTATSGQTDSQGVAHLSYKSAPGMVTNLPPAGLRASAVTPKLLADLGMRASSASSASQQKMAEQVAFLSAHRTAPTFCKGAALPSSMKLSRTSTQTNGSGIRFSHVFTGNWAGYVLPAANTSPGINSVSGTFTVGQNHTLTQPGAEATWVGIGGTGGASWGLIQDGVSMAYGQGYQSWFEFIGASSTCTDITTASQCAARFATAPAGVARPGDTVTAGVSWQDAATACFQLTDVQHPAANIGPTCMAVPIPYDNTSAEWINEQIVGEGLPDGTCCIASYDNPGTINWTNQLYSGSFSAAGTGASPFASGAEVASVMIGTYFPSGATSCGSGNGVISYPASPTTTSTGGRSSIITCSVPLYDAP